MSIFSNPISEAGAEADAYIAAVMDLAGDRDPLEILGRLPDEVERLIADLDPQRLRKPEAHGKWSILEVIQHLADSELVWAYRLRVVLADADPVLTGYDQDRWAAKLRYNEVDPDAAIAQIRTIREMNLRLLGSLTPEEMKRTGKHSERGQESVEHMLRLYAGHDLVHLQQLSRIRNSV
ncbi:MAG: DinB family protein [Acidobacteriota bacterium]|nr:DinB family protein [Acidobacteriota bacterium]